MADRTKATKPDAIGLLEARQFVRKMHRVVTINDSMHETNYDLSVGLARSSGLSVIVSSMVMIMLYLYRVLL